MLRKVRQRIRSADLTDIEEGSATDFVADLTDVEGTGSATDFVADLTDVEEGSREFPQLRSRIELHCRSSQILKSSAFICVYLPDICGLRINQRF